jgi:hypothetical protein
MNNELETGIHFFEARKYNEEGISSAKSLNFIMKKNLCCGILQPDLQQAVQKLIHRF